MNAVCGYCHEEFNAQCVDNHACEEATEFANYNLEYERTRRNGMLYGSLAIAEAEAFLKANPEFIENSIERDVKAYSRIAVGLTYEQEEHLTPVTYESATTLPVAYNSSDSELTREDEWDDIYAMREVDLVQQGIKPWRDVEPTRCTSAYHWWRNSRQVVAYEDGPHHMPANYVADATYVQHYEALDFERPELMRLEFNELQGFTSSVLIDADITEKFQFSVFNAYVGRDQKFHIGLLTFDRTDTGAIAVTCKFSGCHYRHTPFLSPENPDRLQMEDFVTACIRHGNNHAPDWLLKRKDFTFIHAQNCDTLHGTSGNCNANWPRLDVNALDASDLDAVYGYLVHHRKFCRNENCRCTHYYHMLSAVVTNDYARSAA